MSRMGDVHVMVDDLAVTLERFDQTDPAEILVGVAEWLCGIGNDYDAGTLGRALLATMTTSAP